jgi:hemerythrin-like domain-containing protein
MKRINVSLATRIATEHLSYRSLIEEIETDLERVGQGSTASLDGLRKLLKSFTSQVRGHFALEERGGLFEVYDEHPPAFRKHARLMLGQHGVLLERLKHVLDTVNGIERLDGPQFERFSRDLRELIAALRQHERDEDALLERLVDHDIRHGPGHP